MDTEKKIETSRLRSFELFAGLTEEELAVIAQDCAEVTVRSGAILIRQGQVGKEIYLLEEGSVGIYRGAAAPSQFLVVLQAPTLFGEMALVDPERIRTASVKALGDLRLLTIPIDAFLPRVKLFPSLKEKLHQLFAERS
ncbi:MAG: cyclic nucleotide-binding domain-containing protein [Acidobacteria bacterium]|nr:cyclic nucleotide-binding domain-containing protein [Acidobacteriota bacterium]